MSELSERDDRRHHPVGGAPGRDSLFFNLIMPDEELGVQLYTWTDEAGVAGHMVGIWVRAGRRWPSSSRGDLRLHRRPRAVRLLPEPRGVPAVDGGGPLRAGRAAACAARIDGEDGSGQYESLWPADYVQRLIKGES